MVYRECTMSRSHFFRSSPLRTGCVWATILPVVEATRVSFAMCQPLPFGAIFRPCAGERLSEKAGQSWPDD
jgi:hypothetical protein